MNTKYISSSVVKNQYFSQTWGELIVNAYVLLMHYFFQVIQGNV